MYSSISQDSQSQTKYPLSFILKERDLFEDVRGL